MIQIRQKKQNLRNQLRKQFLQNHFRTLRKRHFNFDQSTHSDNHQNDNKLRSLLEEGLNFNSFVQQIREENLINDLNLYTLEAIQKNNKLQAKYLLTIFSNAFKENINPYEKEDLFKISIKLFESFNISHVRFEVNEQRRQFKQTLQCISPQVLSYYISTMILESQYLEQEDQQKIEKIICPSFVNVLFYSLNHPKLIQNLEYFIIDTERSILSILDLNQEEYETGNRQKIKRNQNLFIDIMMNHYFYLNSNRSFTQHFQQIQTKLFWLYDKLTDYFEEIESLFQRKEFWILIEQNFQQQMKIKNSTNIVYLYSIMRTFVDKDLFVNEIGINLLKNNQFDNFHPLDNIIASIQNGQKQMFGALQFLQGILISYQQKKYFEKIIKVYGIRLIEMLVKIILEIERKYLSISKNLRILNKALTMVFIFIEIGNEKIKEQQNIFSICFQKLQGMRKIQQIASWFNDIDQRENSDIAEICELIGWIMIQGIQFSAQI